MGPIRRKVRSLEGGYSLVELLVVIALIGIMAAWGYPSMLKLLGKQKLMNAAREASIMIQLARLEASKRSVPTEVNYQNAATSVLGVPSLIAFADLDGNGILDPTDKIISGPSPLPRGVDLWGPLDATKEGGNAIDGAGWIDGPIFASDGSAQSIGAFRFRDQDGHFLETRIEFAATGKVILRKWFGGSDANLNWFQNGENGNEWAW